MGTIRRVISLRAGKVFPEQNAAIQISMHQVLFAACSIYFYTSFIFRPCALSFSCALFVSLSLSLSLFPLPLSLALSLSLSLSTQSFQQSS